MGERLHGGANTTPEGHAEGNGEHMSNGVGNMPKSARPSTQAETDIASKILRQHGADPRRVGATVQLGKFRNKETGELNPSGTMTTEDAERVWVKFPTPPSSEAALFDELGPLQPIPPIVIKPSRARPVVRPEKVLLDVTDIQYGFRMLDNGLMVPTHFAEGLDILLQVAYDIKPDRVLYGGDEADYAEISRFGVDSMHYNAYTLAESIKGLRSFFAKMRAQTPNSRQTSIASNHGKRPERYITSNAPMLGGMIPAVKSNQRGYPANSYPFLVGLEDLDIEYADGYPAGVEKINDRLFTVHGNKSKTSGSTAHEYLREMDAGMNLLFHHTHRHEEAHVRRRYNALGARGAGAMAFSNGCLADINGAVPGYNSAVNSTGEVQAHRENWINGFGIVEYQEGDRPFNNHFVEIAQDAEGYYAYLYGREYRPLGPELMPEAGYEYRFGDQPFNA